MVFLVTTLEVHLVEFGQLFILSNQNNRVGSQKEDGCDLPVHRFF
jgi:hypothetical protein